MENLFSNIFKYRQTKGKSPLENYCTEIFSYILRFSIETKDCLSYKILEIFGFKGLVEKDLEKIKVVTQEKHSSNNRIVFPDIIIEFNNIINIIEVKVNSSIRNYLIKNKNIDQIELYKKINDLKINDVFSLSKDLVRNNSLEKSNIVLWSDIHSLLNKSENEIIKNFVLFLEENNMVSSILKNGAENGIDSISALMSLIENSWSNGKYKLKEQICRDFAGFWLNKNDAWIGQLKKRHDFLVFEPICNKLIKRAEKIYEEKNETMEIDDDDNYIFAKLKLKDITNYTEEMKQREVVQNWIEKELNKIL